MSTLAGLAIAAALAALGIRRRAADEPAIPFLTVDRGLIRTSPPDEEVA